METIFQIIADQAIAERVLVFWVFFVLFCFLVCFVLFFGSRSLLMVVFLFVWLVGWLFLESGISVF